MVGCFGDLRDDFNVLLAFHGDFSMMRLIGYVDYRWNATIEGVVWDVSGGIIDCFGDLRDDFNVCLAFDGDCDDFHR